MQWGRGRIQKRAVDHTTGIATTTTAADFSSSQLNALAVTIYVTYNLGIESVSLHSVILDDSLQSLDDVNLLRLIDMYRRAKDKRQLIITTHDKRFGDLLERKLRPLEGERTQVLTFTGWTREGPVVHYHDVPRDEEQMKIEAQA